MHSSIATYVQNVCITGTSVHMCALWRGVELTLQEGGVSHSLPEMRGHEAVVIIDMKFLCVAEVPSELAGMGGRESHNMPNLDGVVHLKHQHGRDAAIRS